MSDADTVRFYLDKRDDLAGWLALARLESQNQALQEEVDRLRHVVRHESPDMISCSCGATRHGIAVENQALQERAERAEAGRAEALAECAALISRIKVAAGYYAHLSPLSDVQGLILPKLGNALSPTQETDPE